MRVQCFSSFAHITKINIKANVGLSFEIYNTSEHKLLWQTVGDSVVFGLLDMPTGPTWSCIKALVAMIWDGHVQGEGRIWLHVSTFRTVRPLNFRGNLVGS